MNEEEDLFSAVCLAKDTRAAVAGLSDYELMRLHEYLQIRFSETGITGEVFAVVMMECSRRFVEAHRPRK